MRLPSIICAFLAVLPAMAQEETRNYPLGPIGGQFHVTPNSSYARIVALDSSAPGSAAGLQVGDYLYGAFGKTFTPTGEYHSGVSQELGFAVDRAEGAGGTLPLKVLRPGVGSLDVSVTLPAAGAFGPAYPRASAKHQEAFESACAWLHQRVMSTSNGDVGYPTGWTGLCLLGHPNWNDTTGAKPYRLSINKIRDRCVSQITTGLYAAVEDLLLDGTANPNYVGGALSNWQLGQFVMFLSEYYAKTGDATVAPAIQRGAEMCANTIQWWKQPAKNANGYSPTGTQIAGIVGHGGVTGDYIHLGWGGGINICGVYSFNGMAFARHVGMDMTVRPRDGHYFGYPTAPVGAVEAGKENYDHTLDEKFQMQWDWMGKRTAYYSAGSADDGHVAYTLNAPSGYDAAGRTPATVLGMSLYKRNGGALTADDEDKLARLKAYISRRYIRQQEAHAYCVGAQSYQALATAFLSDRQQRFMLDNWRFFYALSRTPAGGFQYFRARTVADNYLDETQCAAIDMAMPYAIANGGLSIIPAINDEPDQVIANFLSPDITWPTIDARKISIVGSTLAMPVSLVDGQGAAVSSGYTATWTKLSGPGTVSFSAPTAATTDITFGAAGTYRVQLSVTRGSYTLVEPIDVSVRLHPAPAGYVAGVANYQVYTGLSGTEVVNLTGAAKFPNSPDVTRTVMRLAGDYSSDNYGARLSGCVIAPVTGSYRFYIASDDSSQLRFNSSGLGPVGPTAIASVTGWTAANQWNKYASQQSVAFNLTAGQAYSFEALHKESGGGDLLSVGWAIDGGAIEVIDGVHLAMPDSTPATMSIVTHPQPASTTLGGSVTLSVSTTGPQPGFYQWRRNGVNIGAPTNSPSLAFSNASGGAEGSYDCVYTTTLGALTSNAAQVTVSDAGALVSGGLWREVYTGIGGGAVTDLTTNAKFPFNADSCGPIPSAATPADYADDYGQRITGWIKPAVSGNYRFYLASDDSSELWLGTSEQAASKARILQLSGYTGVMGWSDRAPSAYFALQAGRYYYLEIRHKEGGGGDHLALAWQRQGDAAPVNGSGEIPGQYLSYRLGGSFDDVPGPGNQAPSFAVDPVAMQDANPGVAYTGQSLASFAGDFNSADALIFSKLSGPAWLNVASNGALSGTPQFADLGVNTFTVRVADPAGLEDTATLAITVAHPPSALAALWNFNDSGVAGSSPDVVAAVPGSMVGGAAFGAAGSGRSGQPGDLALNLGTSGSGSRMEVANVAFLQQAAQGQKVTISFWQKLTTTGVGMSSFWASSPSSPDSQRGMQAHSPWSTGTVYFDCGGTGAANRISNTPTGVTWTGWNHLAFVRDGAIGQIWINGTMRASSSNLAALKTDFSLLTVGAQAGGTNSVRGFVDDFAVFRSALTQAEIAALASGSTPQQVANRAPVFAADPINGSGGTQGSAYAGTLAGSAVDPDSGASLTYSKVSGPAWLNVAANGTLSGTPGAGDAGTNNWTVQVSDGSGGTGTATLVISVAPLSYTLTYTAGANGTLSGTTPQTVNYGSSGSAITATPNTGYHFVNWSDGSTANPRTDSNVTANLSVTANFAINTYTLTYTAGANGTLSGTTPQTVNYGASSSAVTAVPNSGYGFTNWSDGSTANPRTDTNVTSDLTVTANFTATGPGPLPAPWTAGTIGSVSATVSATHLAGTYNVTGGGAGISGKNDNFYFVSQPWSGNGTITARVASLQNTGAAAKAGVMIRESTATGSRAVFIGLTPSAGAQWVRRSSTGGNSATTTSTGKAAPYWVRLTREGNTFTSYISANGSTWTQVASASISMANNYSLGLAACSGASGTPVASVFDNVSVTATLPPPLVNPAFPEDPLPKLEAFALGNGTVGFNVTGEASGNWILQESTDAVNWSALQTFTLPASGLQHSEADDRVETRFFRLKSSP